MNSKLLKLKTGTTRKIILETISNLVKVGYIKTKVISECYSRTNELTPKFLMLISDEE